MFTWGFVFVFLLPFLILAHYVVCVLLRRRSLPPGPFPWPIIGNMPDFDLKALHVSLLRLSEKYGPVITIWIAHEPWVVLTDAANAKRLCKELKVFARDPLVREIFGDIVPGLGTQDGEDHRRSRRMLAPAFHHKHVLNLVEPIVARSKYLNASLENFAKSNTAVDLQVELQKLTFDLIGLLCLGYDFQTQINGSSPYAHAYDFCLRHLNWRVFSPIKYWNYFKTSECREYDTQINLLRSTIAKVIEERKERGVRADQFDILSFMVQAGLKAGGEWVDDYEIMRQITTFMFAGHDTTTNQLTWLFYYISQNPKVELKVLAEIDEVLGDRPLNPQDLSKLTYLEQVVKETLRMRPSGPVLGRQLSEHTLVEGKEHAWILPKGMKILWSPYVVMHSSDNWADPETFNPDRPEFSPDGKPKPYTFLPFGAGTRACIGEELAKKEIKTVAAMVLQRFQFRLEEGHKVEMEMATAMRARYGMRMIPTPRQTLPTA